MIISNKVIYKKSCLGTTIANNENLTREQIDVELRQIEKKQQLKDLEAKLTEETEQWHTFMLTSKVGKHNKTQKIKREPTKADKESHVSAADRALHKRLAAEVKTKLEAKGKSTKGVDTFEAFYSMLKSEAVALQKEYQPKLRNGINIAVDLVNQVQQDKKDGDVDIRIKIAPNSFEIKFDVPEEEQSRFKRLLYEALELLGDELYKGSNAHELEQAKMPLGELEAKKMSSNALSDRQTNEDNRHKKVLEEEDNILQDQSKSIHQKISAAQRKYGSACKAEFYPNNIFSVGSGEFFVETVSNYYIYPHNEVKDSYYYQIGGVNFKTQINDLSELLESNKIVNDDSKQLNSLNAEADPHDLFKENIGIFQEIAQRIKNKKGDYRNLDSKQSGIAAKLLSKKIGIGVNHQLSRKYGYELDPLSPNEAKEWYQTFPQRIDSSNKATMFLAMLLAEPARWSVSHITNMLLLNKDSSLTNDSEAPIRELTKKEQERKKSREYKSSGIYEHTSMTQSGSDPIGKSRKPYRSDEDLNHKTGKTKPVKNVTNRDLTAVKRNNTLIHELEKHYNSLKIKQDTQIINHFKNKIETYLNNRTI